MKEFIRFCWQLQLDHGGSQVGGHRSAELVGPIDQTCRQQCPLHEQEVKEAFHLSGPIHLLLGTVSTFSILGDGYLGVSSSRSPAGISFRSSSK